MVSCKETARYSNAIQIMGPTQMHVYIEKILNGKVSVIDKGQPKNQPHITKLDLDLIALIFNGILTMYFVLRFNSTVSDDLVSTKLDIVLCDNKMTRV